jgi:phenylacetate-CoA ligase
MYRWMVPRVVFPLSEFLGGRRMWTEVQRLRTLQWWPQGDIEARALERLRSLLWHAVAHVPHYRDLFKQVGIEPKDIRTLSDLSHLPITTKADLRAGFPARTAAENLPANRRQKMTTSGSTGVPLEFYWDRAAADALFGAYLFSLEWAGTALWDTRLQIASPAYFYTNIAPASRLRRLGRQIVLGEQTASLPADDLSPMKFRTLVNHVVRRGHYFIRGYPSSTARLAAQLLEENTALPGYPKVVITFAETLTAANAATIRRAFGCDVVNYYSSWEVPQMGQTCPNKPDVLHVNSERVILRVVRADGTAAPHGEPGRVVVTDLANYVMPFINYFIGDYAVTGPPCPCGRGFPTITSLEGRDSEVIRTPVGKQINGVILGHFLAIVIGVIPYIWEYQAVQNALDEVTLRVVPNVRFTTEFAETLRVELEAFLGSGVAVAIELVDRIPLEPSGKRLIIKSHLAQG